MGFPEEEWTDVEDTLRVYLQSARCSLSHPQINLLAPLAGTPLHTSYADQLALDDYCSDMSHQGLSQAVEDLDLIRTYPDIFPNFYMMPSPELDRSILFELREFLGMAVEHFRWLLCAVAQRTSLLLFHRDWMAWRQATRGSASPGDLRRYYAGFPSRHDFLQFMETSSLRSDPVIATLLRVEEILRSANEPLTAGEDQRLSLTPYVQSIELDYDMTHLTQSIANGTEAIADKSFYATRQEPGGAIRLNQISPFLANVLTLCRTGKEAQIDDCIRHEFGLDPAQDVSALGTELRETLRSEGWVQALDGCVYFQ
jgi:hypothetical protein